MTTQTTHTHTPKTSRDILGDTLSKCSCGAQKWSNDKIIVGGTLDTHGWYIAAEPEVTPAEAARQNFLEMLETEGYGYGTDRIEPFDSQHPDFQD